MNEPAEDAGCWLPPERSGTELECALSGIGTKAFSFPNSAVKEVGDWEVLGSVGAGAAESVPALIKERVYAPGALALSSSPLVGKNSWLSLSGFALFGTHPHLNDTA